MQTISMLVHLSFFHHRRPCIGRSGWQRVRLPCCRSCSAPRPTHRTCILQPRFRSRQRSDRCRLVNPARRRTSFLCRVISDCRAVVGNQLVLPGDVISIADRSPKERAKQRAKKRPFSNSLSKRKISLIDHPAQDQHGK